MTEMDHDGSAEIVENNDVVKHPREHIGIGRVVEPADGIRRPPVQDASIGLPPPAPAPGASMPPPTQGVNVRFPGAVQGADGLWYGPPA